MLLKLARGVVNDQGSLWVQFLRAKYKLGMDCVPDVKLKGRGSSLWRGICAVWDEFKANIQWVFGAGSRIRFWKDKWVEGYGPLENLVTGPLRAGWEFVKVVDMISLEGS